MKKILLGVAGMVCGLALVFSIAAPAQAAALTSAQVQAIIGLLQSFGADQSVINNVSVALGGTSSGSQTCSTFADLAYGNFDTEPGGRVSQLQTWLGISSSTFGFGTYGPRTLALWNSKCGGWGGGTSTQFSASPTYGVAPLAVIFTAGNMNSTGEYSIDFGDGTNGSVWAVFDIMCIRAPCIQPSPSMGHTYTSNGTYTAKLMYQPPYYCPPGAYCAMMMPAPKQVGTVTITVSGSTTGGAPSINGLDAPTSLSVGQTGTWTVRATAPSGTQLRYSVVWGDEGWGATTGSAQAAQSNVQTSASFSHAYQNAGTYSPTFYVSNDYGTVQTGATVQVMGNGGGDGPVNFQAYPTSGATPLQVSFLAQSISFSGDYSVDFGDGTTAQMQRSSCVTNCPNVDSLRASHTYTTAGTYTATLVKKGGVCTVGSSTLFCGNPDQIVGTVTITVMTGWL